MRPMERDWPDFIFANICCIVFTDVSASCILYANIKTTFLVELIDTSGDKDVNINEEVLKCEKQSTFYVHMHVSLVIVLVYCCVVESLTTVAL